MKTKQAVSVDPAVPVRLLYDAIRERHSDVPDAILVVATGNRGREIVNGHFAASTWTRDGDDADEILVAGERLAAGAEGVLETLLHEAAHALGLARGVKTTSRQGRYHNGNFRDLAIELGLEVEKTDKTGWAWTELPDATVRRYRAPLRAAQKLLDAHRVPIIKKDRGVQQSMLKAECECGRIIRASRQVLAEGEIVCTLCEGVFMVDPAELPQLVTKPPAGAIVDYITRNAGGVTSE